MRMSDPFRFSVQTLPEDGAIAVVDARNADMLILTEAQAEKLAKDLQESLRTVT